MDQEINQELGEELWKLERSLAYSNASSFLDAELLCPYDAEGEAVHGWFDLAGYEKGDDPDIDDALRYLELRGLIDRDPEHPTWFAIRDESEAAAVDELAWLDSEEVEDVLGLMNFRTGPIAHLYQELGEGPAQKCEAEQAFVMRKLLKLVHAHKDDWREVFAKELEAITERIKALRAAKAAA